MRPLGITPEVAERRRDIVGALQRLSPEDQVQMLAALWQAKNVSEQFKEDLGEITVAFKKVHLLSQQYGVTS